jgi:ribosomal protein L37AE/L43A
MKTLCPNCKRVCVLRWLGNLRWQCTLCGLVVTVQCGDETMSLKKENCERHSPVRR